MVDHGSELNYLCLFHLNSIHNNLLGFFNLISSFNPNSLI